MCESHRKTADEYKVDFDLLFDFLAKQKSKATTKRVDQRLVELVKWMLMDMQSLENTLAIPSVKFAVEQAELNDNLKQQVEKMRRELSTLLCKEPVCGPEDG